MRESVRLDFDRAKEAVLKEVRGDEVADILRHRDFNHAWPAVKAELEAAIADGSYAPRMPRLVEVPKGELTTRPIAVLHLRDRILYEALMQELAPTIDGVLSEEVYSARLRNRKDGRLMPTNQPKAWAKFQRKGRELYDGYEQACMLTTDITSYFEFVELDALIEDLRSLPNIPTQNIDLLARLLHGLTKATNLHGIPQGPDASSLLGNLYLRPLDAVLRKMDVKFIRFQDDVRVFSGATHVLRIAVRDLHPVVRARHLNLSTAKTKILEGEEILRHFEDSRKDAITYRLDLGDPDVLEDIRALFDDAVIGGVNERDVRFAVYRLSILNDDHAVPWILNHLSEVPYLASHLVDYLSKHTSTHPEIEPRIGSFLLDERLNISAYVETQLVRMWGRSTSLAPDTYDTLWRILRNPAKETLVRQFAARAIAAHVHPEHGEDVEILKNLFILSVEDRPLRRALLVSTWEAGGATRKWLGDIASADESLADTCAYLRTNPKLPPV